MCDSLVATGEATADGSVILAKNSDRQPNEAHVVAYVPRARHEAGSVVRCTYLEVPQVAETFEVVLSKPFWIWGAEMGANEHGVAIANEAVFTREPYDRRPGLIGMDMLRLALERADTAERALDIIVDLLATYGQGGNCGFRHKEYYHNAFLIADRHEAWVLETAGSYWAAERVQGVRSISNGLTIGPTWDRASPWLVEHAVEKGWCRSPGEFDFGQCYSDFLYTRLDGCQPRQRRSTELLEGNRGRVTVQTMMAALRDHGAEASADATWNPGRGLTMDKLCVHASMGPLRPSQTTGAMVAHLAKDVPAYWLTGTSATCTGLFKPVFPGRAGLPEGAPGLGRSPTGTYDAESLWWTHERLHRSVIRDYPARMALYRPERDGLEADFVKEAAARVASAREMEAGARAAFLRAFTESCFERAAEATVRWTEQVTLAPVSQVGRPPWLFSKAWDILDRQAGLKR